MSNDDDYKALRAMLIECVEKIYPDGAVEVGNVLRCVGEIATATINSVHCDGTPDAAEVASALKTVYLKRFEEHTANVKLRMVQ